MSKLARFVLVVAVVCVLAALCVEAADRNKPIAEPLKGKITKLTTKKAQSVINPKSLKIKDIVKKAIKYQNVEAANAALKTFKDWKTKSALVEELLKGDIVQDVRVGFSTTDKKVLITFAVADGKSFTVPDKLKGEWVTKIVKADAKKTQPNVIAVGDEAVCNNLGSSVGSCLERTNSQGQTVTDFFISTWHGQCHVNDNVFDTVPTQIGSLYSQVHSTTEDWDLVLTKGFTTCTCSGHTSAHGQWTSDDDWFGEIVNRSLNNGNLAVSSNGINNANRAGTIDPSWIFSTEAAYKDMLVVVYPSGTAPIAGDSGGALYDGTTGFLLGVHSAGNRDTYGYFTAMWKIVPQLPFGARPC